MKQYRFVLFLVTVLALAALACYGGNPPQTSAPAATEAPQQNTATEAPQATEPPAATSDSSSAISSGTVGSSSDVVTFTDSNNLFSFDIPGDWKYSNSFNQDDGVYVDRFEAPDQSGFIENITGFSDTPLSGKTNGKLALYFIHKYYSTTGKQGDIRISDDSIQPDKSERLKWTSKGGGYEGISFFEVRGSDRKTFLMLTVWWSASTPQDVTDTIDNVIKTYHVP